MTDLPCMSQCQGTSARSCVPFQRPRRKDTPARRENWEATLLGWPRRRRDSWLLSEHEAGLPGLRPSRRTVSRV